jgi:large-conductance mechanosensitive channel
MNTAIRTGTALAATAAVGYAFCTLVFLLWPEIAANFLGALFHGLEFRRLQNGAVLFDFGRFAYVLLIIAVCAFWLGALFAGVFERLGRRERFPGSRSAPESA